MLNNLTLIPFVPNFFYLMPTALVGKLLWPHCLCWVRFCWNEAHAHYIYVQCLSTAVYCVGVLSVDPADIQI